MEDFNEYAKNNKENISDKQNNVFELAKDIAKKFDGKNTDELLTAIYKEAKKGKKNGTLKNSDIDGFVAMLSPMLDDKKRRILIKVAEDLKRI